MNWVRHGSSTTWFQTSRYCRAKVEFNSVNLVRHGCSTTFETGLTKLRQRRQWERLQLNRFIWAKQHLCTCITHFCTFHCRPCTTTTWNDQILSWLEKGNGKAINFTISFWSRTQSSLFNSNLTSLLSSRLQNSRFFFSKNAFSLVPDLLFDCSRLLSEYAKIRTVLQSTFQAAGWLYKSKKVSRDAKSIFQRWRFLWCRSCRIVRSLIMSLFILITFLIIECLVKVKKTLQKPCTINLALRRIQKDRDQSK